MENFGGIKCLKNILRGLKSNLDIFKGTKIKSLYINFMLWIEL